MIRIILLFVFVSFSSYGDQPLRPPKKYEFCSLNQKYCFTTDPATALTTVYTAKNRKELWQMPGWYRQAFISDDGKWFAVGYNGMNLLPPGYSKDTTLVTFYLKGKEVKSFRLLEIIGDPKILKRTSSHYAWGHQLGFSQRGTYLIQLVDERVIEFVFKGQTVEKR